MMSNTNLIIGDILFVVVGTVVYVTDGVDNVPIVLKGLLVVAFASCIIRHINYYKHNKRIY